MSMRISAHRCAIGILMGLIVLMPCRPVRSQSAEPDALANPGAVRRLLLEPMSTPGWALRSRISTPTFPNPTDERTPHGALWRAAALPGWGQIYNRQYIKLPFVYGALGGLLYSAVTNHHDYVLYREAFQYKAYQELVESGSLESNPRSSFKDSYDQISAEFGPISSSPLRVQRNNLRRTRDLSLIGCGLVYGLAMLDAYVSAHLLDFDVGEDLGFSIFPAPSGVGVATRIRVGR